MNSDGSVFYKDDEIGNDELIYYSRDTKDNKFLRMPISRFVEDAYLFQVLLSRKGYVFHIKISECEMPLFMLKYGGIIKKSPSNVYRMGRVSILDGIA